MRNEGRETKVEGRGTKEDGSNGIKDFASFVIKKGV
jgi:hypothetical protein